MAEVVASLRAHGRGVALTGAEQLTYSELADAVAAAARHLRGRLAFVFGSWDVETVVGYLAARQAGAAVGLFPAGLVPARRSALLDAYRPDIVLGDARPAAGTGADDVPEDLDLLLSTSGSLGSPRVVRLGASGVAANTEAVRVALDVGPSDVVLPGTELASSYGLSVLHSHLAAGAAVVLTRHRPTSSDFWRCAAAVEATTCAVVPHTLSMLAGRRSWLPSSVRTITVAGGAAGEPAVVALVEHLGHLGGGGHVFVMYGQTEATARLTVLDAVARPDKIGSAGRPVPGVTVTIDPVASEVQRLGIGAPAVGEVVCRTPGRMWGYASGRADLGAPREEGPLATGDLGWLDAEGFLHVVGRVGRVVKVLGNRISLDEVEAALGAPGEVAVGRADGERLRVACTPTAADDVRAALQQLCTDAGLPVTHFSVRVVDALPTTATGKVDYGTLDGGGGCW